MVRIVARGEMSPGHPSIETDRNGRVKKRARQVNVLKDRGRKCFGGGRWGSGGVTT